MPKDYTRTDPRDDADPPWLHRVTISAECMTEPGCQRATLLAELSALREASKALLDHFMWRFLRTKREGREYTLPDQFLKLEALLSTQAREEGKDDKA